MVNTALGFAANVLSFLTEQKMISINRLQNRYSTTLLRQYCACWYMFNFAAELPSRALPTRTDMRQPAIRGLTHKSILLTFRQLIVHSSLSVCAITEL